MKTFISKYQLLLLVIILFGLVSSDNKFMKIDKPFQPFISVLSPDSLKQFEEFKPFVSSLEYSLNENNNKSAAEIMFSEIKFSVKCMYVNNFNLYDISGLGKNVLDKEKAYSTEIENVTIFYNFCYDLKKTEECQYDKKQIFFIDKNQNESKCDSLAGSVLNGNKWFIGNDTNGINYLKIELNNDEKYPNHTFKYILQCIVEKKTEVVYEKSYFKKEISEGQYETLLYIMTNEACPKFDFYVIWEFINDNVFIFSIALIAFGFFNCILGNRAAKYTCFLITLFTCVILVLFFGQFILPSGCAKWIIWVILIIGIIIGAAIGFFVFRHHKKVLSFLVGGVSGFFLGQLLFSLFGNLISWNQIVVNVLFVIICIIISICLAYWLQDAIIIFATSFIGAYTFIRGISLFAGGYPNEFTVIDLKNQGEDGQLKELITWRVWIYLVAIIIATGLSIFIQFKIKKNKDSDNDKSAKESDKLIDES